MTKQLRASIPPPSPLVFKGAIRHPQLWLWDSWACESVGRLHLYCLALNRRALDGAEIAPGDRNSYPFHVRHFVSADKAATWRDCGAVLTPQDVGDGSFRRNVWSGSATLLPDHRFVFAFTGIREAGTGRAFLQTLCIATGTPDALAQPSSAALSCPERDYDAITRSGYYLGPRDRLGDNSGEDGGPILAWRDPFLFTGPDARLHLFWSAKIAPSIPAIGHARLAETESGFRIDALSAPITLPDAELMTQAEVPKIYWDARQRSYVLLISACDRLYEGQPDHEVSKVHRLYVSDALTGPWRPYSDTGSLLQGLEATFGASIIAQDLSAGAYTFLAPYTEHAPRDLQLTFAPLRSLTLFAPMRETKGCV